LAKAGWFMKYVYLPKSIIHQNQRYVGLTSDVRARVRAHNAGQSNHRSKYKPWELVAFFAFGDDERALEFEKFLKSGSGRAFANKHFR
jgi:predicted GIY-YIG superfamily endonuclease